MKDKNTSKLNTESQKLKAFRVKNGLTQQELADNLNISQQVIAMVENGKRKAPDSLKLNFLRLYKIDFDELGDGNKTVDLPSQNIVNVVKIPFYYVYAAAGSGEPSPDYPESDSMYFDKRWLENVVGVKPEHISIIQAKGDSMNGGLNPIKDGDLLFVDTSKLEPINNQVFVVRLNNQDLVVKRISKDWQGSVVLCSDNPNYSNIIPSENETFIIVGQVVWNGSKENV